jgi:hypothetical protein
MITDMEQDIATFFRDFALRILTLEHVDPHDPHHVKMALLNHYEEIYPAFTLTVSFQKYAHTVEEPRMIEAYKHNFSLLLMGRLPE